MIILEEFGFISKHNFGYANNIPAFGPFRSISVHFINSIQFGQLRSTSVNFGPIQSTSIQLGPLGLLWSVQSPFQSTLVNLIIFSPFCQIRSICSTLVQFGPFGPFNPLQSIRSNLVHMVHLGLFDLVWSIWSYLIHSVHFGLFGPFGPFQITSVQVGVPT